jgi:hypothetical protein
MPGLNDHGPPDLKKERFKTSDIVYQQKFPNPNNSESCLISAQTYFLFDVLNRERRVQQH